MEKLIEIDHARAEDIPALVRLLNELFRIERDFVPDSTKQERGLRLILDNPAIGRIFVVRVSKTVVGMASLLFTISTAEGGLAAVLEDVIVASAYRRLKVGRRLVRHIKQWAREQEIVRLTLLADRSNDAGLSFYQSEGFTRSETLAVYRYHF